jgi:hypothetical protein
MRSTSRLRALLLISILFALTALDGCDLLPRRELTESSISKVMRISYTAYVIAGETKSRPVKISKEGPWDFSGVDQGTEIEGKYTPADTAGKETIAGANYVEATAEADSGENDQMRTFIRLSEKSLELMGHGYRSIDGTSTFRKAETPERLLVFPLKVGSTWKDSSSYDDAPGSITDVTRTVVARGEVIVPAGAFYDCFMIKVERAPRTENGDDARTIGYEWWSPDAGPVAAVVSRPGEKETYFSQADSLFTLKSVRN